MHGLYRIHKIFQIKKELKEVYTNQAIEYLARSIIGIFIPAYLIASGFSFLAVVLFMLVNHLSSMLMRPLAAKINSRIGVKHTILLRSPVFISYLAIIMNIGILPSIFYLAAVLGGIALALYWTSISTEYIRVSDKRREGEEAGLLFGIPHISAVIGPVVGAMILTLFGFNTLFMMSVALVFASVLPLFLSSDYKSEGFKIKGFSLLLDKKKAAYYFTEGTLNMTDFLFWGLFIFLNFGFISLGIAASLMGLGMLFFTLVVGRISNTIRGRRNITRTAGILSTALWIMRFFATSELEVMILSLLGGFIITSFVVSIFADFAHFAKEQGVKSVVFRQFWLDMGRVVPILILVSFLPGIGAIEFIKVMFIVAALVSLILVFFR